MPHERFDREIEELGEKYEQAGRGMLRILLEVLAGRLSEPEATTGITDLAGVLLELAAAWVRRMVPEIYRAGVEEAHESMGIVGDAATRAGSGLHPQAQALHAEDLLEQLAATTDNVSTDAKRALREIARRRITDALSGGGERKAAGDFAREMEERGIRFLDKNGRKWQPRAYAETVVRTLSAEVLNDGHVNTAAEIGSPGVAVTDGGPGDVDEPCRRANGQVWSLAWAAAHKTEHPNCRRAFAAKPSTWTGTLDRE